MNIILTKDVRKTWFTIREASTACEDVKRWKIRVSRQACPDVNPIITTCINACNVNFWFDNCTTKAPKFNQETTLEYDVLDVDGDRFCVYWDDLIHSQPAGRYRVSVIDHQNEQIGGFAIVIPKEKMKVSGATHNSTSCC
ncbi:hypothetical protein V757_11625 [Pelistega indica]|uniref:Uncharacterized protein n=1 Tax=Pelistega indica TaxID=1414851 RepID=V8FUS3_9BURK|nr:hypothetical protein [Pelistega indica]ETD67172.1 hypothetical protein V757_11625 [Pelistega indica]